MVSGPSVSMMRDVTDVSGPLGDWRVVLAGGLAVLTAGVLALVARDGDPATADTIVMSAVNAAVVRPDGSTAEAVEGLVVPPGSVVRTGTCASTRACGAAQLRTAGRDVYLGAGSTLDVVDGVRQGLEQGLAMVDARGGPKLALTTRAGVLAVGEGSLVRVELGPLVMRVGAFTRHVELAAVGRQVSTPVPALHQVRAPYVGLPADAAALQLTGDVWERTLAADLVAADRDLTRLAAGLAGEAGRTVLTVAPVALRPVVEAEAARVGDSALELALATAGRADGDALDRLATVRTARDEGGSWGVVAAMVEARVSAVSAALDTWLETPDQPVDAAGSPDLGGLVGSPRPAPGPSTSRPGTPGPSPTRTRSPSAPPTTPPPSSPPPDLITTITGLLSPTPSPSGIDLGIIKIHR